MTFGSDGRFGRSGLRGSLTVITQQDGVYLAVPRITWVLTAPLRNLVTNLDGQADLNGALVITTGDQTYGDPVVLTTDVTLQAANVTFEQTVDSDGVAPWNLTVITQRDGVTWFRGNVGTAAPLGNLVTNLDGQTDLNGALVITTGDQTYGDPVVLTRTLRCKQPMSLSSRRSTPMMSLPGI